MDTIDQAYATVWHFIRLWFFMERLGVLSGRYGFSLVHCRVTGKEYEFEPRAIRLIKHFTFKPQIKKAPLFRGAFNLLQKVITSLRNAF